MKVKNKKTGVCYKEKGLPALKDPFKNYLIMKWSLLLFAHASSF